MAFGPVEIHIDLVSDTSCPWCYIGKKRMETAFGQFSGVSFSVEWIPYLLSLPEEVQKQQGDSTCPYSDFLCARFGEASAMQMISTLVKAGDSVGVQFNHKRPLLSNTIPSHCLIKYAKRFGRANEACDAVMKAYFEGGADISNIDILVEIAVALGFDGNEARGVILDPKYHECVRRMAEEVKKSGVSSVPTFVVTRAGVSNRLKFSGAQRNECFVAAIKQMIDPDTLCLVRTNLMERVECNGKH